MCGYGNCDNGELEIYLGDYGCYIALENNAYNPQNNEWNCPCDDIDKDTFINNIKKQYTYDGFIRVILECIENGREC